MARVNVQVGRTRTHNLSPLQSGYVNEVNKSARAIRENLKKVIDAIQATSAEGLKHAMEPMFDTSQRLVPKDTLALARSGYLEARQTQRGASISIGYGRGGNPSYAGIVHERMGVHHDSPTQAKYLEEAVNQHIREVPDRYARFVGGRIGLR